MMPRPLADDSRSTRLYTTRDGRRFDAIVLAEPLCDLCLAPKPHWAYPAVYVPISAHGVFSDNGHWLLCDGCHDLVEASDCDGLVKHIAARQPRLSCRLARQRRQERTRRNAERFLGARTGPPKRTD